MKRFMIAVLMLLLPFSSWGATYYVDPDCTDTNPTSATVDGTQYNAATQSCTGGSDSYYATLADLGEKTFAADDFILLKRGKTFRGQVRIYNGGTAGHPITIGAFGPGAKPIIQNTQTLTSWTQESGNIYYATLASLPKNVFIGDTFVQPAHWPTTAGSDPPTFQFPSGDSADSTHLTDSDLHGRTEAELTGARVRLFMAGYVISNVAISAWNDTTHILTMGDVAYVNPTTSHPYFLTAGSDASNTYATKSWMMSEGTWFWDSTTNRLYVWKTGGGSPGTVDYTTQWAVATKVASISNITFDGLHARFTDTGFYVDAVGADVTGYTIKNCEASYNNLGIESAPDTGRSVHLTVDNVTLDHNNMGVWSILHASGSSVKNSTITNNAMPPLLPNATNAIGWKNGTGSTTTDNNTITNALYGGISCDQTGPCTITNNTITNTNMQYLQDGGGIYTGGATGTHFTGSVISGNTLSGGTGYGIYLDEYTDSSIVENNSVTGGFFGIFLHFADNNIVRHNTVTGPFTYGDANVAGGIVIRNNAADSNDIYYNLINCTDTNKSGIYLDGFANMGTNIYNNVIANCATGLYVIDLNNVVANAKNNIFYNNTTHVHATTSDITAMDYNLYYPNTGTRFYWNTVYNFADWKTNSSLDANSPTPADPLFVSSNDFHLQGGSPAIDKGTNVSLTTDYVNNKVPVGAAQDIGAYERQGPWYIANSGSDSATGGGQNSSAPWQTISKINSSTFGPGNTIYFKKGDIWRESLVVPSSGSAGNPITFGAYGSGAKPRISAFDIVEFGGPDGNGVYQYADYDDERWLTLRDGLPVAPGTGTNPSPDQAFWGSNYVWYKPPAGHTPSEYVMEVSKRYRTLYINGKDYITVDGLQFQGGNGESIETDGTTIDIRDSTNITITNFDVRNSYQSLFYVRAVAKDVSNYTISNGTVEYGVDGIEIYGSTSYAVDNVTIDNVVISNIGNWANDTRASGNVDREGIGINGYGNSAGYTLTNLSIHDVGNATDSNNYGIFIYQVDNVTVSKFEVYNCARTGIAIWDGAYPSSNNVNIRHGIVRNNGNTTISSTQYSGGINVVSPNGGGLDNLTIYNVDIYGNGGDATTDATKKGGLLLRDYGGTSDSVITIKNNIISHNNTYDVNIYQTGGDFTGETMDRNLYYRAAGTGFMYNNVAKTWSEWQGLGYDTNGVNSDPLYVTAGSDFHLQVGSPAIDKGINVSLTSDYAGNLIPVGGAQDIGAYERQGPWYVANSGSDTAVGGGQNSSAPWQTVSKVNSSTFGPGNTVYFKKGDTWREQLTPPSSGSTGNPITFGAYGTGARPVISGADLVTPGTSWSPAVLTFGYTTTGELTTDLGTGAVTCGGLSSPVLSGTVSNITIDISNADSTADIKVGLYTDSSGVPSTKVGTEQETTNHATFSREWHDFPYSASVTGGNNYWVCLELSATGDWTNGYTASAGNNKYIDTNTYGTGWASTFTNNGASSAVLSIYAKYSPTNIWAYSVATEPIFVLFDGVLGRRENTGGLAALSANGDYYWSGNILYVYADSDPDTKWTSPGVEIAQRGTALSVSGKDYLTFDGIDYKMSNTTDGATSLIYVNDSDGTTLTNFNAKYSYYFLLWAKTATGNITDLTISNADLSVGGNGMGVYGIASHAYSWSGLEIDNVVVHDISNWSANFPNDTRTSEVDREGIGINGYGDSSGGNYIHDIEIYNVGSTTNSNNTGMFLYQNTGVIVERFKIHDCNRSGLWIEDGAGAYGHDIAVRHGLIYGNGKASITSTEFSGGLIVSAANTGGLDNLSIYNNTIYDNGGSATSSATKRGGLLLYSYAGGANASTINVKNNLIFNNATYDLQITEVTAAFTGITLDYNLIYRASGNMIVNDTNTYDYSQFATYKSASGYDTNSINADPLLVSAGSDFRLQSGSPAINAGTNVGLTTDYQGFAVVGAPDAGALEYGSPYYVDQTLGADANAGTIYAPWKTISKVNGYTFYPGYSILFKKGETWNEQLLVPASGGVSTPITFGAYGIGTKPILSGTATTNLQPYPSDMNNSGWVKVNCTISNNSSSRIAPDGTQTADGLISDAVNDRHRFDYQTQQSISGSTQYTYSAYVSPGDVTWAYLDIVLWDSGYNFKSERGYFFNLSGEGSLGTPVGSATATIKRVSVSPLWYRVSMTFTTASDEVLFTSRLESANADGGNTYLAAGSVVSNYWWGAQMSAGSQPGLYAGYTTPVAIPERHNITIDGLNITNYVPYGIRNHLGDNVIIQNNTVTGGNASTEKFAIYHQGVTGNLAANGQILSNTIGQVGTSNNVDANATAGIFAQYTNGVTVNSNAVATVKVGGINVRGYNGDQSSGGATIHNNVVSSFFGAGISVTELAGTPSIRYNHVYGGSGAGIAVNWNVTGAQIYYNLIHDLSANSDGYQNGIDINQNADDGFVYNNTVYKVPVYSLTLETNVGGWTIKNNIFDASANVDNPPYNYGKYCILSAGDNTNSFDYNQYNSTGGYVAMVSEVNKNFADWKTQLNAWGVAGKDASSADSDPMFVSSSDFHLKVGSPAINAGVNVGLTTDYAGNTVPYGALPDIGAYEWGYGIPILTSPADAATGVGWPVDFVWEVFPTAMLYHLQVDDNADFSSPEIDEDALDPATYCGASYCTFSVTEGTSLDYSTHYYWHVRALVP